MAASFLPSILASTSYLSPYFVPIIGWVLPGSGIRISVFIH